MKPTIEEVREYFKNAAEIECLLDTRIYDLSKLEIIKDYHFFNNGVWLEVLHEMKSVKMWDKQKGYAKIITYKNNMEITEQQIKDLESGKVKVKELFPDLFKEKLYTEKDLVDFGNKVLQDAQNNFELKGVTDSQIENFKFNR